MDEKTKKRFLWGGLIIGGFVLLWLLLRSMPAGRDLIREIQSGFNLSDLGAFDIPDLGGPSVYDLPEMPGSAGNTGDFGHCSLCFGSNVDITLPASPPAPPPPAVFEPEDIVCPYPNCHDIKKIKFTDEGEVKKIKYTKESDIKAVKYTDDGDIKKIKYYGSSGAFGLI